MPISTVARGSTQDGTSGVPVAQCTNESGSGILSAGVAEGNKSTYTGQTRSSQTSADTATTDLSTAGFAGSSGANLCDVSNALNIHISGQCSDDLETLTGRIIFYNSSDAPIGMSEIITLTSDSAVRVSSSGDYLAYVTPQLVDAGRATQARFYILTVSAGTWSITITPV